MDATTINYLVQAGSGGLIIIVVLLFLRFLTSERANRSAEHDSFMRFIADQSTSNNDSLAQLTNEIRCMNETNIQHHTFTIEAMNEVRATIKARKTRANA